MPIVFKEYNNSPSYSGNGKDLTATRVGKIQGDLIINSFYLELFPAAVGGYASLPALLPGSSVLYADSVSFEPLWDEQAILATVSPGSVAGPINQRADIQVTITYKTIPYQKTDSNSPVITRHWSVGGQMQTLKNVGLRWKGAVGAKNQTVAGDAKGAKFVGTIVHEITSHRSPTVPWAAIRSLLGKTNDATFEGAAQNTLLLLGVSISEGRGADDSVEYDINYRFEERIPDGDTTITWNHIWDDQHNGGQWREVETAQGASMYLEGDFTQLVT